MTNCVEQTPMSAAKPFGLMRIAALATLMLAAPLPAAAIEFGLPVACSLGEDCFVQQFPDMDPGTAALDPFCGAATYDGHDGTDFRVRSMRDVAGGVPVIAMADGTVLRGRDGVADRLVRSEADRRAVAKLECGNGMVVDHGGGWEVQYCHLRQGSIVVRPGQAVRRGDRLGAVGASGMAAFPHVHVTVRKDGAVVDPATGRALDGGCAAAGAGTKPLFSGDAAALVAAGDASLVGFGLAGGPVDHDALSLDGPPPPASSMSNALVGWVWFINMRKGDRLRVAVTGPDGAVLADQTSEALDRSKASFAIYTGKRGRPRAGQYEVAAILVRDGKAAIARRATFAID